MKKDNINGNNSAQNMMMNNNMMNNNFRINFDNLNLIEFITLPIIIKNHPHPLIFCKTLDRSKFGTSWNCNNCFEKYTYDQPSFYCTFCDYDICRKCVENLKLNEIHFYDFCKNKIDIHLPSNGNFNWTQKYIFHEHLLTHIIRQNQNFFWCCDSCHNNYLNLCSSYHCSLCNYDICFNCFFKNTNMLANMLNMYNMPFYNNNIINPQIFMNNPFSKFFCQFNENKKPIIYLYPEKPMKIKIQLNIKNSKITVVYPKFNKINNTWEVKAEVNGDIILNDKKYPYLFYELESYIPQLQNEGFIVKDEEAEYFLENKLKILGLNNKESTDFITYWLPILLKNKISLCTFQSEAFFNNFELNINPKPDTLIRIFLSIKKIDSIPDIKEQKLEKIERRGFTVIEWGGTNIQN